MDTLRIVAKEKYKHHKSYAWTIGLLCGFFITAVIALDIIFEGISIFTIPFIILPFLFACFMDLMGLGYGKGLTLKAHFHFMGSYFAPTFRSTFRFLFNLLKALLVLILAIFIIENVVTVIYRISLPNDYEALMEKINTLTESEALFESDLNDFLYFENNYVSLFFFIIYVPSILIAVFYFIYLVSFNSLSIYIRLALVKAQSTFLNTVIKSAFKKNRKGLRKNFIKLNWPMFLLLFIGINIGAVLSAIYLNANILMLSSISIVSGLFFMSFYLPRYFYNLEAIYDKYENSFKQASIDATKEILFTLNKDMKRMSEEDKKEVESSLEDIIDASEESKKKDSSDES